MDFGEHQDGLGRDLAHIALADGAHGPTVTLLKTGRCLLLVGDGQVRNRKAHTLFHHLTQNVCSQAHAQVEYLGQRVQLKLVKCNHQNSSPLRQSGWQVQTKDR